MGGSETAKWISLTEFADLLLRLALFRDKLERDDLPRVALATLVYLAERPFPDALEHVVVLHPRGRSEVRRRFPLGLEHGLHFAAARGALGRGRVRGAALASPPPLVSPLHVSFSI